jgi:hypothetical protein
MANMPTARSSVFLTPHSENPASSVSVSECPIHSRRSGSADNSALNVTWLYISPLKTTTNRPFRDTWGW